jgi:ribose 1,5-bisphosphokinase PhnN
MWTLLALTTTVWAQQDAYYHSNQIAEASQVFAAAAEASAPQFQAAQTHVGRYSIAMEELEIGTLIAAKRLSDDDRERSELVRRRIMQAYMQTARHVDLLQSDYETIFTDALERALAQDLGDYNITECGATGIAALTGQSSCNGVSLNEAIAALID